MKIFLDFDNTLTRGREFSDAIISEIGGESAQSLLAAFAEYRKTNAFTLAGACVFLESQDISPQHAQGVYEAFAKRMNEFIAPDAHDFLTELKNCGHDLVLVTRSPDVETWQRPKVLSSGLAEYFSRVEITDGSKANVIEMLGHAGPFVFIDDLERETGDVQARFPDALCITHVKGSPLLQYLTKITDYAVKHLLPLPLYTSQTIGFCETADGEKLAVTFGLDEKGVDGFKKRSCDQTDEELMRFTSDYKRMCLGSYEAWYAKERYPFALLNKAGELAGIIWFGPKAFPDTTKAGLSTPQLPGNDWHTFAIRMYGAYRGKRLAFPFASFVFEAYTRFLPHHPVWLDTDAENAGAIRLYGKLGFKECGLNEHGRLVMARE